jgi:peptidoglycan/LPS O-acetylase OafA/YrhL
MFQHWMFIEDIDGIYWTLAVEMCFYILIFLVFIFGKQKNIERIGIVWLLVMIALYFLIMQNVLPSINYFYYVPLLRNGDLFFAGILFYQLKNNPADKRKHILIFLCLLTHFVINSAEESFAIAFIFVVLYLFVIDKLKFLRGKIPFFFGYICYPLYLLHQYIGYEIINSLNSYEIESTFLKVLLTGMIIIAIATCVTLFVERPAMRYLRKKLLPAK